MVTDGMRFATRQDYRDGREFCIVHFELSCERLKVNAIRGLRIRHQEKDNLISSAGMYLPCGLGRIDSCQLGVMKLRSQSPYRYAASLIDYAENIEFAIVTAKNHADQMRSRIVAEIRSCADAIESAPLELEVCK